MAIQPSNRLAGSAHILRFQGVLVGQAGPPGPQTVNGEVALGGVVAGVPVAVRFALADMSAIGANPSSLADLQKRLPSYVYDDTQPTGSPTPGAPPAAPHSNTGTSSPELQVGKTWAQNIRVRAMSVPFDYLFPEILAFEVLNPLVQLDGLPGSGLGLEQSTGVPVVILNIVFTAAGLAALVPPQGPGCSVTIEIEVVNTSVR